MVRVAFYRLYQINTIVMIGDIGVGYSLSLNVKWGTQLPFLDFC